MANRFYAANERRADKVHELFGAIASRYDLINDLQSLGLHRYWKRQLVKLAELKEGERALDLCCGTGDVVFQLAKAAELVVGLDFSLPMLTVAQERARRCRAERHPASHEPERRTPIRREDQVSSKRAGSETSAPHGRFMGREQVQSEQEASLEPSRCQFLRGDALRLPFQDAQFDVVTISYGLRNLENFQAGLNEMGRILKPRGRLLILDFGKPDNAVWRALYFGYLRWCVPWFGKLFCGDWETYAYILESLLRYPAQRGIADLMMKLDYSEVRMINLLGGVMSINYGRKAAG
jgi:ubiquinone/menaquinone biosynthesis C-methylase UbiE